MRTPARAMTIIEVTVSMLVISSMLAASLYAVGASRTTTARSRDRVIAAALADDLLGYVYRLDYESPSGSILGLELGNLLGDKTTYDDVDDFDGYEESPPLDADNVAIDGLTGWNRGVSVEWVDPDDPSQTSPGETGIKRITVTVTRDGVELARRAALRTQLSSAAD